MGPNVNSRQLGFWKLLPIPSRCSSERTQHRHSLRAVF